MRKEWTTRHSVNCVRCTVATRSGVRRLSPDGGVVWKYDHRTTSTRASVALGPYGTLVVSEVLQRERATGFLLFEAAGE
jgi:hypothetical protein